MSDDKRYPLWLHHPNEQPAILSDDYENGPRPPLSYAAKPGRPRICPPVQVNNRDQEAYYVSRGYLPGNSTLPAYITAHQAAEEEKAQRREEPDIREYPKWVHTAEGSVIAKDAAHEAEILARGSSKNEPVERKAKRAERKAAPDYGVAQPRAKRPSDQKFGAASQARWAAIAEAKALGIPADKNWRMADVQRAIAERQQQVA